jgi:hypothetical protein
MAPFLWGGPVTPTVPTDPVTGLISFVETLLSIFGLGKPDISGLTRSINETWGNLVQTSSFVYNAIGFLSQFLERLLRTLFGGLIAIVKDVLHGHLLQALKDIRKLIQDVHKLFLPLITWLKRLQAIQRQQQMLAMRRILNLIQRARRILVPLRILHVKFAQKLDNWLAGIEGRIITRELAIVSKTNEIIAWIDLITNPTGGLRGPAVLRGVARTTEAILGAFAALGVGNVIPARQVTYGETLPGRPFSDWEAPFFKTEASSPSRYEQFNAVVDAYYERIREEHGI